MEEKKDVARSESGSIPAIPASIPTTLQLYNSNNSNSNSGLNSNFNGKILGNLK
ncbi:MAG: hypothetical protein K2L59_00210 [Muribaculaceae bacterium]|nr:hypothetical protein [Muribaculaceae bacterium]